MNLQRPPLSADEHVARLSESELQALRLLAEGHTAKSIAIMTGLSVGAVNERLRQARRKTGAGSSRELARLVHTEKVGDEKIGMATPAALDEALPAHPKRGGRKVMAATFIGGIATLAAIAALVLQPGRTADVPENPAQSDEMLSGVLEALSDGQPHDIYKRMRLETRDASWAPSMEAKLKTRYSRIQHVSGPANAVRVTCSTTLCEVAGWIDLPEPKTEPETAAMNVVTEQLQGPVLRNDLAALGLERSAVMFGQGSRARPDRSTFVMYWGRKRRIDPTAQNPQADDLLGPLVGTAQPDPRQLHAAVRLEKRDESWAPRMEAALEGQFSKVPRIGGASNPVRVICGSNLCEVAAIIDADEKASPAELSPTYEALAGEEMLNAQKSLSLEQVISGYGETRARKTSYFAYLRRKTG